MKRRNLLKYGLGGLAGGAVTAGLGTAHAEVAEPHNPVRVGTPGGPEIPGGPWQPVPGKTLDGGPGYNHPGNILDGALRKGRGTGKFKDISPLYTYKNIPSEDEVEFKTFHIDIVLAEHELVDGIKFHALAFNGMVPGPQIHVNEGDWVKVIFRNKTELPHTIHWHGLFNEYEHDGLPFDTQPPVLPKQQFIYKFQADPPGTHFYHCHWSAPLHQGHAMHGAIIVHAKDDPIKKMFPYEREYVLVLEAFAIDFSRNTLNKMIARMKQRIHLFKQGKMTKEILGSFKNYEEMQAHIRAGWIPAYDRRRNQGGEVRPNYNFFAINGKSYPATDKILIKPDEWIRIRLINGTFLPHYMHMHGHDFFQVATDGAAMAQPIRRNTVPVFPGSTTDIVVYGNNPGTWGFHDHDVNRATNNGVYPGGMLTALEYEGFVGGYAPVIGTDE